MLDAAADNSASRCQRLADKLALCPDLFGDGASESFLAGPGPPRAQGSLVAASSHEVEACAYRVEGSSGPCQAAFSGLVDCIQAPTCAELAASCAAPLAEVKTACQALVSEPSTSRHQVGGL